MDMFLINWIYKSFITYTSKQSSYQNTLKDSLEHFFCRHVTKFNKCVTIQNWDEKWQSALWIESQEDRNSHFVSISDLLNDCSSVYELLLTILASGQKNPQKHRTMSIQDWQSKSVALSKFSGVRKPWFWAWSYFAWIQVSDHHPLVLDLGLLPYWRALGGLLLLYMIPWWTSFNT